MIKVWFDALILTEKKFFLVENLAGGKMIASKKENGSKIYRYIVAIVCFACILVGGFRYVNAVQNNLMKLAVSNVLTVTQQQQQAFDNFITKDRERLHSYVMDFTAYNFEDAESIRSKLSLFSEVEALYTLINLETGDYYNNKTTEMLRMTEEELALYSELSGSGVRSLYTGLYAEGERFGYYESFTFSDGSRGLFQKGYDAAEITEEFSLSFYNEQGTAYVIGKQGDILMRPHASHTVYGGSNLFDMIGLEDKNQGEWEDFQAALDKRESGVLFADTESEDYVYTYVPIENVEEWYLVSVVPKAVIMDEANQIINDSQATVFVALIVFVVLMIVFVMMRTFRKNIHEKNQEIEYQEELFDVFSTYLSENTDDVYMMLEGEGLSVDYVSPNAERVLGISRPEDVRDIILSGYFKDEEGKEENAYNLCELKTGESLEPRDVEWVNPNTGEYKCFQEKMYCVTLQGVRKIVIYISDRTKEREIQKDLSTALDTAKVANKAKSVFLSSMSHDIRTPMNAITGLVTLLKQEADNPQYVLEYAQRIDVASQHLLGLINDVLDMNKIESGNTTLNITELNLADIIDGVNMIIRPQARARRQKFEIYTSALTSDHLLGDSVRINQILINMLSNAVKYTQEGGTIEMRVRELPRLLENYSRIEFSVKDNGQGMTEEYQKVMFSPFTREHETATNKVQGTGLGMAITKSLVELMGGTINVESKVGVGTTFTIELELRVQEQSVDPYFWEKHGVHKMLVADDDITMCENVAHAMRETGVEVDFVSDGDQVIDTARRAREEGRPYDLLLLDWKMPNMNGMEAARLIRKNYSRKIPILLFTAYDWADIEQEAVEVGIDHFLPKPFFMSSFMSAIKRIMGGKEEKDISAAGMGDVVRGRHILVVEDIEVNRMVLMKILSTRGAVCDIAVNGKEAVDKFVQSQPGQYDIILMDVQMPVMDGYEATRAIRASGHPCAKEIPIIAMTANAFADDVKDALSAGMDAHVSKPVILEKLEAAIKKVLD